MHLKSLFFAGALLLTTLGVTQNTTIIGNVAASDNLTGTNVSSTGWKAMGFTMGGSAYDLTEVHIPIDFNDPNPNVIIEATLYSNNLSDDPGTKLLDQNKVSKELAVWRFNAAGTALSQWLPLKVTPELKFNHKGFGRVESI